MAALVWSLSLNDVGAFVGQQLVCPRVRETSRGVEVARSREWRSNGQIFGHENARNPVSSRPMIS